MIEKLKSAWSSPMSWEELAEFCDQISKWRRQYRESRGIKPPRIRCSKCGTVSRSAELDVSIRSALFALKKNGIISETEFKNLDKEWKKHRKDNGLDPYGKKPSAMKEMKGADETKCC